ncbi:uncharacterized protein LOC123207347 [Mangifera indica]|uniref:uncharacterized protein LOC123207347 n=1 Tax=Mangifera indica TaxID=29780 RepID=UPI001CFA16B3|nr:uncharacterized protein LOC123207347 [Mangifera indica]
MRNSFLSDLLRFANPTENLPSRVNGIDYNSTELSSVPGFNLYGKTDSSSICRAKISNLPNLTSETYLGARQSTDGGDISFLGTEIDEFLTRASRKTFENSPINLDGVVAKDCDDGVVLGENYTATFTNEEELPETQPRDKVKRRRLSSSASEEAAEDNDTAEEEKKLTFSEKLKWLKNLLPACSSKGSDTVTILEDAAKYVRSLQRKREVLKQQVDPQTFMESEELRLNWNGKFPTFKPVNSKSRSNYPFILPAPHHQILMSRQPERQGCLCRFSPETSMSLPPLPDVMPLPDLETPPDFEQQVQPLSSWEDELQKLVNQFFR